MRTILIGAFSLLLSVFVGVSSFGITNANRAAELTSQLSPVSGFASARRADLLIAPYATLGGAQKIPQPVELDISSFSIRAFAEEPFTPSALRNLALIAEQSGQDDLASGLMQEAAKLTRRDVIVNIWRITQLGKRNNVEEALQLFDMTMRGSWAAKDLILPSLQNGLKDPAFINPMVDVLRKNPRWGSDFWTTIDRFKDSIPNAGRVRKELARTGYRNSIELDQQLLNALVSFNHFNIAEDVFASLSDNSSQLTEEQFVRNSDFQYLPVFAPFDWEVLTGANFDARILPGSSALQISSGETYDTKLVRQLVLLPGGKLRFLANLEATDSSDGELYVSIYCADKLSAGDNPLIIELKDGTTERDFLNDIARCNYFWLEIKVRGNTGGTTKDFSVQRLTITPA